MQRVLFIVEWYDDKYHFIKNLPDSVKNICNKIVEGWEFGGLRCGFFGFIENSIHFDFGGFLYCRLRFWKYHLWISYGGKGLKIILNYWFQ